MRETMVWHDVTIPMHPEMTVWPGDPPFSLSPADRMSDGAKCNTSVLGLSTHTGTHCDAPWHFVDEGRRLDKIDPAIFFGAALLLEIRGADHIRADDLPPETLPPRVLFKTDNAAHPVNGPFLNDFVALEEDAAERLVRDGVQLVGIDYLSIAPRGRSQGTHRILLENNVFVVEGLVLRDFAPGMYPFVVLPMAVAGADGAPCRAFIGTLTPEGGSWKAG